MFILFSSSGVVQVQTIYNVHDIQTRQPEIATMKTVGR